MHHSDEERVIALAGLFQAVTLVKQIARKGHADEQVFTTCINSLLITEAEQTIDIYGGYPGIQLGLNKLIRHLSSKTNQDLEITRYIVSLLHLERKLNKIPKMLARIGQGIDLAKSQAEHFAPTHENVIANLAGIYGETISNLPPKIIVQGEHGHLAVQENASKVRALLLAGMRATILWRQCGGTRWQLLFQRKKILATANGIMNKIN